jgi:hypothetical protein
VEDRSGHSCETKSILVDVAIDHNRSLSWKKKAMLFSCRWPWLHPQGADPHLPPTSTRGKAGRNHLTVEITPLLPSGISERFRQTLSNLGHAAHLRRCELPVMNESAELTQGAF